MKFVIPFFVFAFGSFLQGGEFLTADQIKGIIESSEKESGEVSAPRQVLFCWSKPDHPKDTHGYQLLAESFAAKLSEIEEVEASAIEGYPNEAQWKMADLVVFNLTQSDLSEDQWSAMDHHMSLGKSVMVVHQGLVQRKGYDEWAKRLGIAFSWDAAPARSKWGAGKLKISLNTEHEIFRGFPKTIEVDDELYWNLKEGKEGEVSILGETMAPKGKQNPDGEQTKWPVFWTTEHGAKGAKKGEKSGRVFCCVIGHFDELTLSSSFETVMMRAFAWCLREPAWPFLKEGGSHE